jgi:hypothetical protein
MREVIPVIVLYHVILWILGSWLAMLGEAHSGPKCLHSSSLMERSEGEAVTTNEGYHRQ